MLTKLIPPQYRMAAIVTALAALVICSFVAGWKVQGWRMGEDAALWREAAANAVAESAAEAKRVESLSSKLADANGKLFLARQAAERASARVVTKEVIKYVQADYAGKCDLPVGWVRIDTASAAGVPKDDVAITGADGSPSGVTDARAIEVITERNAICRNEIEKVRGLQAHIIEQHALLDGEAQ